jgi:hypothetical protein
MLNHMAPSREAVDDALGVPMDGVAGAARQLGAKGIPGANERLFKALFF